MLQKKNKDLLIYLQLIKQQYNIWFVICKNRFSRAFIVNMAWQLRDAYKTAQTGAEYYSVFKANSLFSEKQFYFQVQFSQKIEKQILKFIYYYYVYFH